MDICNPTGETITLYFDSVRYSFEPKAIVSVHDEAGRFLVAKGRRVGLVEVHFGDDPDKIRLAGLRARTDLYRATLQQHQRANERQEQMKFPPLPESEAVRNARIALPIYEKALGHLEEKIGKDLETALAADIEEILEDTTQPVPSLANATIEALRDEYRRVTGEEPEARFNQKTLRVKIQRKREEIAAAQASALGGGTPVAAAPVAGASGSAVAPGPMPGIATDDLLSGPLSR